MHVKANFSRYSIDILFSLFMLILSINPIALNVMTLDNSNLFEISYIFNTPKFR